MQRLTVFRSRFFWKIYLTFSLLFLITLAVIGYVVSFQLQSLLFEVEKKSLIDRITLMQVEQQLQETRNIIISSGVIGILLALGTGLFLARQVTVPITQMMRVCESMRRGNYNRKVHSLPKDEIGLLGDTLNQLAKEITTQFSTIKSERAQLKTMLASMVEGIISIDDDNRVQFCNRAAYKLLNSDLEDCRGYKIEELKGFSRLCKTVELAKSKKELVEGELTVPHGEENKILESYCSPFKGMSSAGVIIVLHDVTHLRKLETMRKDFVANVSHEIKTPLTSIKGYVETLLSGALDDKSNSRKFLEKVDQNATRLLELVEDLLSLAKIESQEESIRTSPTDWSSIIREVISHYEDQMHKKKINYIFVQRQDLMLVMGDKDAMMQVFENLLTNAIKYTPESGTINVSVQKNGRFGVLQVEDTGIGIPETHLDRIFERFYRVDKARSRELKGTGLGLSIVKHLVQGMNGKIEVDSEVGIGSRFRVLLPLAT